MTRKVTYETHIYTYSCTSLSRSPLSALSQLSKAATIVVTETFGAQLGNLMKLIQVCLVLELVQRDHLLVSLFAVVTIGQPIFIYLSLTHTHTHRNLTCVPLLGTDTQMYVDNIVITVYYECKCLPVESESVFNFKVSCAFADTKICMKSR